MPPTKLSEPPTPTRAAPEPSARPESHDEPPPRIRIEHVSPVVDGGRYAAKRCVGDEVDVGADIFRDGHEVLRAVVRHRPPGARSWREVPMREVDAHLDGVRWVGSFTVEKCGRHHFAIEAWSDRFAGWREELERKAAVHQPDLSGELSEGAVLLEQAIERIDGHDRGLVEHALRELRDPEVPREAKIDAALGPELFAAIERHPDRHDAAGDDRVYEIDVDRERARFGAWYEVFPRSWGGLEGVRKMVPELAALGFDVLYLAPIHPIGKTNRKGKNNSLTAGPDDPGSPWAIGCHGEGGHEAVHPELGTLEDVRKLCAKARAHDMDVALDLAIQCSADHPWLTEHPEWFHRRPDGTLKYAENPPKKYQDIYNVNFDSPAWRELWDALLGVFMHWVDHGVTVFRVDNPHTKPFAFWEWLIAEVRKSAPETVFLSEAFTRRAVMRELAKLGFSQSYTYFTWKNSSWELSEYVNELAYSEEREYFRPNFFPNTPDILHAYLQHGGRPAFEARFVLAATLSPSYGIYSGYEHFENVPARPGSEEYLDSEKYEIKQRALDGPLLPLIRRVNEIRRENPALRRLDNITFLETHNAQLMAYAKRASGNTVVVVVNIDPWNRQEGLCHVPSELGLPAAFLVHDLFDDARYGWGLGGNYVGLEPGQSHIFRVEGP